MLVGARSKFRKLMDRLLKGKWRKLSVGILKRILVKGKRKGITRRES